MSNVVSTIGQKAGLVGGALTGLFVTGLILAGPASAAEGDDPALDAITGFGAKVTAYGAAMVAVVVIAVGIMLGVKYLRKAASKA